MEKKEVQQKKGRWNDKFVKPGFILGIISICTSILIVGAFVGIPGIVFSALGTRTLDPALKAKDRTGLITSIIGTAIGFTVLVVLVICLYIYIINNYN